MSGSFPAIALRRTTGVLLVLLGALLLTSPAAARTYTVRAGDTPIKVARRFGVSVDALLRTNGLTAKDGFRAGTVLEIPPRDTRAAGSTYTVRPGDSIAKIADHFGVSQRDLCDENGLRRDTPLQVGQVLVIPHTLRTGGRGHVVRPGDTLARIAKKYGISPAALAAANKMDVSTPLTVGRTLVIPDPDAPDKPDRRESRLVVSGKKVRGGVVHTVQQGQSLWHIARAYRVSEARIRARNKIPEGSYLRPGTELFIPGAKRPVPVRTAGYRTRPITFVRVKTGKVVSLRLVTNKGAVIHGARKRLSRLAAPVGKKARKGFRFFHPRLIRLLQRVAERYPGATFEIISGYRRSKKGRESQHTLGRAIDFRVRGVPNRELYELCTTFPNTGCGYYPNSVFVHMDVRNRSAAWTDYSRPGEPPRYAKKGATSQQHDDPAESVEGGEITVDEPQTDDEEPGAATTADSSD